MPNRYPSVNKRVQRSTRSQIPQSPYEISCRNEEAKINMRKTRAQYTDAKKKLEREKAKMRMRLLRESRSGTKETFRKPYNERVNNWSGLTARAKRNLKNKQRKEQREFHRAKKSKTTEVTFKEFSASVNETKESSEKPIVQSIDDNTRVINKAISNILKPKRGMARIQSNIISEIKKHSLASKVKAKFLIRQLKISHKRLRCNNSVDRRGRPMITDRKKEIILAFYEENSRALPLKQKDGTLDGRVLECSIKEMYDKFLLINGPMVSRATFVRLRPKHIKCASTRDFLTCLCESCCNIKFKLESINRVICKEDLSHLIPKEQITSLHKLSDASICSDENFSTLCLERECENCVDNLKIKFSSLCNNIKSNSITVNWKKWKQDDVETVAKSTTIDADGKRKIETVNITKKKNAFVNCSGTLIDLIEELLNDMKPMAQHIYIADHQQNQRRLLRKNMPQSAFVMDVDYSQNIIVKYREEPQSAHYTKPQFTLFPVAAEFLENEVLVREEILLISDDLTHDVVQSDIFVKKAIEHLKSTRGLSDNTEIHVFSDRCASQFSNKSMAYFISHQKNITWNYYGVRHGKNPSDTAGANFKTLLTRHILNTGDVVDSCSTFSQLNLPESSSPNRKRSIICISLSDMKELRENYTKVDITPVVGIKKIHQIKSHGMGKIEVRHLSCYCSYCLGKNTSSVSCQNEWKQIQLNQLAPIINTNICSKCSSKFSETRVFPWLQCCSCSRWYCKTCLPKGIARKKNPFFICFICERIN